MKEIRNDLPKGMLSVQVWKEDNTVHVRVAAEGDRAALMKLEARMPGKLLASCPTFMKEMAALCAEPARIYSEMGWENGTRTYTVKSWHGHRMWDVKALQAQADAFKPSRTWEKKGDPFKGGVPAKMLELALELRRGGIEKGLDYADVVPFQGGRGWVFKHMNERMPWRLWSVLKDAKIDFVGEEGHTTVLHGRERFSCGSKPGGA